MIIVYFYDYEDRLAVEIRDLTLFWCNV